MLALCNHFFNLMYFMLLPRAHFILYTLQGTGGLGPGPGDGIPENRRRQSFTACSRWIFSCNTHLRILRFLHARHCAVIAWQQMRGTIGTHFPQQFPLLGSAFNNLSTLAYWFHAHYCGANIWFWWTHRNTYKYWRTTSRRQVVFQIIKLCVLLR